MCVSSLIRVAAPPFPRNISPLSIGLFWSLGIEAGEGVFEREGGSEEREGGSEEREGGSEERKGGVGNVP